MFQKLISSQNRRMRIFSRRSLTSFVIYTGPTNRKANTTRNITSIFQV